MNLTAGGLLDVASILSEASEDDIRDYEGSLQKLRSRAAGDLQQNVYQNRTQSVSYTHLTLPTKA